MALPYQLVGGATRPDAISGLNPAFSQAMTSLYNAAPPQVQAELGLTSAYRSPEVQRKLYEASDKSGKMVAAPGKSKHNFGTAADLAGFGLKGSGGVSPETKAWVHQNAGKFGLTFPMDYEPWHIQLADAAGAGAGAGAPPQAPAPAGDLGTTLANSIQTIDPTTLALAMRQANPLNSVDFTDMAEKRGGLVGAASAGGMSATADAAPSIPAIETAAETRLPPTPMQDAVTPLRMTAAQNAGPLASLFKLKTIGSAAYGSPLEGQAKPLTRRA